MCCRTSVHPLDRNLAATILTVGQFKPSAWTEDMVPVCWERYVPEEAGSVVVSLAGDAFDLSLVPAIHAYLQHHSRRITASIYFEIAARYAEKVGGEILQKATVPGCRPAGGAGLLVARYPSMPMSFDNVCSGFQHVLIGDFSGSSERPC